ncbi:hypothetical protein Tco_0808299 [Tanacetum coccineum]
MKKKGIVHSGGISSQSMGYRVYNKRTRLMLNQFIQICEINGGVSEMSVANWYEMFDSSRTGGSGKMYLLDISIKTHHVIQWWRYPIPAEVGFLTTFSAQNTKIYGNQDSEFKKVNTKINDYPLNSDIQDLHLRYQVDQGRLLASFQEDAKYEHVGQDTRFARWQRRSRQTRKRFRDLETKDNDKGSRSKIT